MRLVQWGRGRLKVYGNLSRKKKVCVGTRGGDRRFRESLGEFSTRPKGEEPEILHLGDVLLGTWVRPSWG